MQSEPHEASAHNLDGVPRLVPLDEAMRPYRGVTRRMLQCWVRTGRLPAVRAGRGYLVSPADLASLLTPKLREPKARKPRESESSRIARQLAQAGVGR